MNARSAEALLPCYRPGKKLDPQIIKAARFAEGDATLREKLEEQMDFDEQVVEAIRYIVPPENFPEKLDELCVQPRAARWKPSRQWFNPAALAVVFGVILIAGFVVHLALESRTDFPGKEVVAKMIDLCGEMNGTEFEAKGAAVPASQLGDALYMAGFEGFALPEELAALPAVGWRVFRQQGHRVAQLAVERRDAIVFVFRASDFGVQAGPTPAWRILERNEWVGALNDRAGLCTLVAFRGNTAEMQQFLQTLTP